MEAILVPAVFVMAGLTAVIYGVNSRRLVRRSQTGPYRYGQVTHSEVVRTRTDKTTVYKARVEYLYEVDGREHRGDTLCIGGTLDSSLKRHAEKRRARYPLGARVEVFYDPMQPETSCLEKTGAGGELLFYMGWACAGSGACLLLRGF